MNTENHDDFGGLQRDIQLVSRRRALAMFGAVGFLAACTKTGGDNSSESAASSSTANTTPAEASSAGTSIPSETQGPYPADGSNGPNVLSDGAVVRRDLTTSFGDYSGTAPGIPTTINLTIVDATTGSAISNAAVYLWHCTADGRYSIYEVTDQNYLRGLQASDESGKISFTTVFPGCYNGRWPHCHFEIFDNVEVANSGANARKVSQLALPEAECAVAYSDARYGNSASNLSRLSLASDNVFADGWTEQLATVTGSVNDGFQVNLLVRV